MNEHRGSVSGVVESIQVHHWDADDTIDYDDLLNTETYAVTWTGIDGMPAAHSASPKTVAGTAIPNQTLLLCEITTLPGDRNSRRVAFVIIELDDRCAAHARIHISGRTWPLEIIEQNRTHHV